MHFKENGNAAIQTSAIDQPPKKQFTAHEAQRVRAVRQAHQAEEPVPRAPPPEERRKSFTTARSEAAHEKPARRGVDTFEQSTQKQKEEKQPSQQQPGTDQPVPRAPQPPPQQSVPASSS